MWSEMQMIVRIGTVLALALTVQAAEPDRPTLASMPLRLSFAEEFDRPASFYHPQQAPRGQWKTNYFFSVQPTLAPRGWESRTLRANHELQYYGDPFDGTGSFSSRPGSLEIIARPNPYLAEAKTHGLPYLSGLITTETSHAQRYGFFEARLTMPVAKGLWPAFWLLPVPKMVAGHAAQTGQQEIDVVENVGDRDRVFLTVHHDAGGKKKGDSGSVQVGDVARPHDYGVLWSRDWIVWYIDRREVRRVRNRDFHTPAYMLLNLAVGGDWPGSPDAATHFPARLSIDWVRAYSIVGKRNGAQAAAGGA
jgi:beta-glucanase (GH16 family)